MPYVIPLFGAKTYGRKTAAAGTVINTLVEPMLNAYTVLSQVAYSANSVGHTLTVMRPLGVTTSSAVVAAGANPIVLSYDPGLAASYVAANSFMGNPVTGLFYGRGRTANNGIATNDWIVYQSADGGYNFTLVTMTGLSAALTTNVPTGGILAGAPIWFMGIAGDTNPIDNTANPTFAVYRQASSGTISTTQLGNAIGDGIAGMVATFGKYEPLLVQSNNITEDGYMEKVTAFYTNKGGPINY